MIDGLLIALILGGCLIVLVVLLIAVLDSFDALPDPLTAFIALVVAIILGTKHVVADRDWQFWAILSLIYYLGIRYEHKT